MRLTVVRCLALGALLLVSGCGDHPATPSAPSETHVLAGTLAQVGGPFGNPATYPDGTITLRSAAGSVVTTAAHRGRFSVRVAPGRYTVIGHAPSFGDGSYECRAERPVLVDHDVTGVEVLCQMR